MFVRLEIPQPEDHAYGGVHHQFRDLKRKLSYPRELGEERGHGGHHGKHHGEHRADEAQAQVDESFLHELRDDADVSEFDLFLRDELRGHDELAMEDVQVVRAPFESAIDDKHYTTDGKCLYKKWGKQIKI